jgi:ribose transport system permease protein
MTAHGTTVAGPAPRDRWIALTRLLLDNIVWVILAFAMLAFSIGINGFASPQNYINIVYHAVFIGILAIAEAVCLLSGQLDLSIESIAGFSAILSAYLAGSSRFASGLQVDPFLSLAIVLVLGRLSAWSTPSS